MYFNNINSEEEENQAFKNIFTQNTENENDSLIDKDDDEQLKQEYEDKLYFLKPEPEKGEILKQKNSKEITTATSNQKNNITPNEPQQQIIPEISESKESNTKSNKKVLGRKKKSDKSERTHTKSREDNKMRKIKVYIIRFILNRLNQHINKYHRKFLKIDKKIGENLKKDFNIKLMNMKIKEIFSEFSINGRYLTLKQETNLNIALMREIYAKNDIEVIKILESKYIDLLNILRKDYLEQFRHDVIKKEIKCGEDKKNAEKYVEELIGLLLNYEEWFKSKSGRERNKKV